MWKNKRKYILIIIISSDFKILFKLQIVKAEDNTIARQKETFGINSFLKTQKNIQENFLMT